MKNIIKTFIVLTFLLFTVNSVSANLFSSIIWTPNENKIINLDISKDFDLNNFNEISYFNSILNNFCSNWLNCNLILNIKNKDSDNSIDKLVLSWTSEELELYKTQLPNFKSQIKDIKQVELKNQSAYLSNLYQSQIEKSNSHNAIWITIICILLILLDFYIFNANWKNSLVIAFILIIFSTVLYNYIKQPIIYKTVVNWKETPFFIFNKVDYLEDLNNISVDELKERNRLNEYYSDFLLEDIEGKMLLDLTNERRQTFRKEFSDWYTLMYNEKPSKLSFYTTDAWIVVRVRNHYIKEMATEIWTVAIGIWMIYAKHRISSHFANWNSAALAINNLTTIWMSSDLMLLLKEDMKSFYIP